jgi:Domain of unknown function (DUF1918)
MELSPLEAETDLGTTSSMPRFRPGQRILAARSGHCAAADSLAEVLQVVATETAEIYRVRWQHGVETFFVPGPEAHDRREHDAGPPPGLDERRRD